MNDTYKLMIILMLLWPILRLFNILSKIDKQKPLEIQVIQFNTTGKVRHYNIHYDQMNIHFNTCYRIHLTIISFFPPFGV